MDYYQKEFGNLPEKRKPESIIEKLDRIEEVGVLHIKGYRYKEIAELLNDKGISITPATVAKYASEYKQLIAEEARNNPDFMDRVHENTLRFLKSFDEIEKEAWETVTIATDAGMVGARINALKLALEVSAQKARLLQLLGGQVDSSYLARMQRAESVNQILSSIIAEIVSDCDHCRDEARIRISEALAMMGNDDAAVNSQPYEDGEIIDAEIEEEDGEEA